MTERQPVGGLPLVAYVTALIAIPIAGLIVLGGREVAANDAAARDARIVAETIENQTTAIAVLPPLQVERIVALGTARVNELDLDPGTIDVRVAADLTALLDGNTEELSERLAAFDAVLEETGSTELAEELAESVLEIAALRVDVRSDEAPGRRHQGRP